MFIYAFGSICTGELDHHSDVDILIVPKFDAPFYLSKEKYTIYSVGRLQELWRVGNAFAWHLALESRMIYSTDGSNLITHLGRPAPFRTAKDEILKFKIMFETAIASINQNFEAVVFDMSIAFLAIRNAAICYSIACHEKPMFGRRTATVLGAYSVPTTKQLFDSLESARLASTRGLTFAPSKESITELQSSQTEICNWFRILVEQVEYEATSK